MLKIKVKHKIGDVVQVFGGAKYKVIGYSIVGGENARYTCVGSEKTDELSFSSIEIEGDGSPSTIGFY